jgi:type I restriction enzyme, S subunit
VVNFDRQQELKSGWKWVKFGDVVKLSTARCNDPLAQGIERYVGLEHIDSEDLRIQRWGLVEDGITFTSLFKPGQVLFGKRRAYLRKVAVPDFAGVCSGDIYVFDSANSQVLLPELLPFICQTDRFFEYAIGTSAGSLSPRTNWKSLVNFEFALPSLEEQLVIINTLKSIDSTLEYLLDVNTKICNVQDALIFEKLISFSKVYPVCTLQSIADVQYGLVVNSQRRKSITQVPYLRVANVRRDSLDLSDIKTIGKLKADATFILQVGDILIVEGHADPQEVGRAAIWDQEKVEMLHQNHLIRVRCKSNIIPDYLCIFINSSIGQQYFRSHAKSTSGLNTLNSSVVKNINVFLPPILQQNIFVENTKILQVLIKATLVRVYKLRNIRKNILSSIKV